MVRTIGIGVIGMGWMGTVHSRSYRQIPDRFPESRIRPRLVICADEFENRALAAHARFGFENYTTNWQGVIAHPDVEVVDECLDHVMAFNESSLRRILRLYFDYYQGSRTHLALAKDAPEPRDAQPPEVGAIIELPHVGGLHHRYERRAA